MRKIVESNIRWRGSVTDLATDVAYLLTSEEGKTLVGELVRFQVSVPAKWAGKGHEETEPDSMSDSTEHIERAFEVVRRMPELERGLMTNVLLRSLRVPEIARNVRLPESLVLVPGILKGRTSAVDITKNEILAFKIARVAWEDRPFVENYIAGRPAASFL